MVSLRILRRKKEDLLVIAATLAFIFVVNHIHKPKQQDGHVNDTAMNYGTSNPFKIYERLWENEKDVLEMVKRSKNLSVKAENRHAYVNGVYSGDAAVPAVETSTAELHDILVGNARALIEVVKNAGELNRNQEYRCIPNIMRATLDVRGQTNTSSVTWCSCSTDNNMHYVDTLASVWDGPISLTVFTYGPHVLETLAYMSGLRYCRENIKRRVSFHLCIPGDSQEGGMTREQVTIEGYTSCDVLMAKRLRSINYDDSRVAFPINLLRNVAIKNAHTEYVLNADIDMIPSHDLRKNFDVFSHNNSSQWRNAYTAFVLPSFESKVTLNDTVSKTTLLDMWSRGVVRPFYTTVCKPCQGNTDYGVWRSLRPSKYLNVAYFREWKSMWEPFLITRKDDVPLFNEAFKRYGFNRISQMCELYMKGFRFAVMDNGFLIHDGFKENRAFHDTRNKENKINQKLYQHFRSELKRKYPNSKKECHSVTPHRRHTSVAFIRGKAKHKLDNAFMRQNRAFPSHKRIRNL